MALEDTSLDDELDLEMSLDVSGSTRCEESSSLGSSESDRGEEGLRPRRLLRWGEDGEGGPSTNALGLDLPFAFFLLALDISSCNSLRVLRRYSSSSHRSFLWKSCVDRVYKTSQEFLEERLTG